jgi:hypothetical protein
MNFSFIRKARRINTIFNTFQSTVSSLYLLVVSANSINTSTGKKLGKNYLIGALEE